MRKEKLYGCVIGGAIGDAWGSSYENVSIVDENGIYYLGEAIERKERVWMITDDTQLTLITLEALTQTDKLTPDILADTFVQYFRRRKLTGIGSSTLKALQELEAGGHWSQTGRSGEYAAGNGAAMRIAPFAFWNNYTNEEIRNFCRITHRNDEAYAGALAVVLCIRQALNENWSGNQDLINQIIPHLPDTNVRDRLVELNKIRTDEAISAASKFGISGYVAESVPFAIFSAMQIKRLGMEEMLLQIISCGGDTDTNASIAGQIAGSLLGEKNIPSSLKEKLKLTQEYGWIISTVNKAIENDD